MSTLAYKGVGVGLDLIQSNTWVLVEGVPEE